MTGPEGPLLRLRGIHRSFGSVAAVRNVDLDVHGGTVHALLGENGAGKSTLMNVVYGVHQADRGSIEFEGQQVSIGSPRTALALGIAMVHQHHQLVPSFTVAESMILASDRAGWRLDRKGTAARLDRLSEMLGVHLSPDLRVSELSLGDRQRLEILTAIDRNAKVIILDEPSAVLAPTEVEQLFVLLRMLAERGHAVILITHRMKEVFRVSDRISVMRKGELLATLSTELTNPDEVLDLVISKRSRAAAGVGSRLRTNHSGDPAADAFDAGESGDGVPPTLDVRDLMVAPRPGSTGLKGCSLQAWPGEIVGIAGVEGNGQHDLVEVLGGVRIPEDGAVVACGTAQAFGKITPQTAVVPEDRHHEGLVLDLSSEHNLVLGDLEHYSTWGFLSQQLIRERATQVIEDYGIVTSAPSAPVRSMSGGNQQKVVLARALAESPRIIVASQATRGLDPGAAGEILDRLRAAAEEGAAVVFISSDLDEVVGVADRALVMYDGKVVGESQRPAAEMSRLAELMIEGSS